MQPESPSAPALPFELSPQGRRAALAVLVIGAVVGALLGVETLALHLTTDPFADTRVYYDAGARLNAGLPLYDVAATGPVGLYLYPPLVAILFRPLALLPFPAAAVIWQGVILGAFALTLRRIGLDRRTLIVLGWLALPICWALAVGQVEPVVTLLLTLATPASIALAGSIKLVPWLAAVYWVARRDRNALVTCAVWVAGILGVQFVLAPGETLAYLQLTWLQPAFDVRSISPYVMSPVLWVALVVVLLGVALRYGPTTLGWPLAVLLAVFAYPRLLVYQLSSLLAIFGGPREPRRSR